MCKPTLTPRQIAELEHHSHIHNYDPYGLDTYIHYTHAKNPAVAGRLWKMFLLEKLETRERDLDEFGHSKRYLRYIYRITAAGKTALTTAKPTEE